MVPISGSRPPLLGCPPFPYHLTPSPAAYPSPQVGKGPSAYLALPACWLWLSWLLPAVLARMHGAFVFFSLASLVGGPSPTILSGVAPHAPPSSQPAVFFQSADLHLACPALFPCLWVMSLEMDEWAGLTARFLPCAQPPDQRWCSAGWFHDSFYLLPFCFLALNYKGAGLAS